jgi:hypothetical protein
MREVLKSFIPRQHWAASNVEIVPTVANVKQLAQWGGVGVFTAFWMIGAFSFTFRFAIFFSLSLSLSLSFRLRRPKTSHRPRLLFSEKLSLFDARTTGDKSFAWAKSFVVEPPSE